MSIHEIRVIAGLGNIGREYQEHRHNIGFTVVRELARRLGMEFGPADSDVEAAVAVRNGATVHLLLPQRYMNRSGQALAAWSRRAGIALTGATPRQPAVEETGGEIVPEIVPEPIRPLIVCDDLSLPLGSVRFRVRGSSGGQNGLESIIDQLGGEVFPRLRLGIAPGSGEVPPPEWADLVLSPFAEEEREPVQALIKRAVDALECWLERGTEQTASRHNFRVRPALD